MTRKCTFLAIVDGTSKWFESYAIDRQDAIAQMRDMYLEGAEIEVVLFRYV